MSTENLVLKIKRLPHAHDIDLPKRMTSMSSGFDVCAAIEEDLILKPGERVLIPTGFIFDIPRGFELQVRPRSGLAWKHGITVLNTPGTIDADYRGEVKVILINLGNENFTIKRGERIAQIVPARVIDIMESLEVKDVSDTERGSGGFGHTGSK